MTIDPAIVDQLGLDLGPGISTLMRRFYPLLLEDAYSDAGAVLSLDLVFYLENEFVQETLDGLAKNVRAVAETTKEQIRSLVGKAAQEGWGVEELARQIRETGEIASVSRSVLIAQTETATAYSQGSILAYQESGVVSGLEWLVAGDPCPICDPLDGQVADLGKAFAGDIPHPPAHPGCRCAIAPVVA